MNGLEITVGGLQYRTGCPGPFENIVDKGSEGKGKRELSISVQVDEWVFVYSEIMISDNVFTAVSEMTYR